MTNRLHASLLLVLCAAFTLHSAPVAIRWTVETSRPAPLDVPGFAGETIYFQPSFASYGAAISLANTTAALYYQTNGMGSTWWSIPATIATGSPDRVQAIWSPTNDCGASRYTWFIAAITSHGTSYRAHGTLRLATSPGATPSILAAPTTLTDALQAWGDLHYEAAGASNALASALQSEAQARAAGDAIAATSTVARIDAVSAAVGVHTSNASIHLTTAQAAAIVAQVNGTGTVAYAGIAQRLGYPGASSWQTVENGTGTIWVTTQIGVVSSIVVTARSAYPDALIPPPLGSRFYYKGVEDNLVLWTNTWGSLPYLNDGDQFPAQYIPTVPPWEEEGLLASASWSTWSTYLEGQSTFTAELDVAEITQTNSHSYALSEDVEAIRTAVEAIPTNVVSGWLVWDSGSNRYWRVTATNLRFYVFGDVE